MLGLGKYTRIGMLWCIFALGSCNENIWEQNSVESDFVEFYFRKMESRADITPDGSGSFREGDRIELCAIDSKHVARNFLLSLKGGEWQPRLTRRELGDGAITLTAYYPPSAHAIESDARYHHTVVVEQDKDAGYGKSDLLLAGDLMQEDDKVAELTFSHLMHRLEINLLSPEGEPVSGMEVSVLSRLEGTVDSYTREISLDADGQAQWVTPADAGNGKYVAVLFPQPLDGFRKQWIRIRSQGKEVFFGAPAQMEGQPFNTLEKGRSTKVVLTVIPDGEGEAPSGDFAGRTFWVANLNEKLPVPFPGQENLPSITPPWENKKFPENGWFKGTFDVLYMAWNPACGWYDCNKDMKNGEYTALDSRMCWAAASSNTLHWWIANNRDYIERYYTLNPDEERCPSAEFSPGKSAIWDMYRDAYQNKSGSIPDGVNWFFTGVQGEYGSPAAIKNPQWHDFKGFFRGMFAKSESPVVQDIRWPGKKQFNDALKAAFTNGEAIGYVLNEINYGTPGSDLHSLTAWGAEFDKDGYACALYYVNNNNGESDPSGASVNRKVVVYSEDGSLTFLKNDESTQYKKQVIGITRISLRQDVWKEYFKSHSASPVGLSDSRMTIMNKNKK